MGGTLTIQYGCWSAAHFCDCPSSWAFFFSPDEFSGKPSTFYTWAKNTDLGGGFKHFLLSPLPGEMIQFD